MEAFAYSCLTRLPADNDSVGIIFETADPPGCAGVSCPVIPTPLHVLDRISPILPPFFPVFCAFSPSRRDGSNEPQAGTQGRETVARGP